MPRIACHRIRRMIVRRKERIRRGLRLVSVVRVVEHGRQGNEDQEVNANEHDVAPHLVAFAAGCVGRRRRANDPDCRRHHRAQAAQRILPQRQLRDRARVVEHLSGQQWTHPCEKHDFHALLVDHGVDHLEQCALAMARLSEFPTERPPKLESQDASQPQASEARGDAQCRADVNAIHLRELNTAADHQRKRREHEDAQHRGQYQDDQRRP
eukprot:CAMPEP_0117555946 /NCGR_PEP_ID=MMETSP0784-20121206/51543_1 /TAXON_ID=39447 /ORGANISM="" /LENGTH=210 /DNA_ID=CAMNT_0005353181 /DNA_START=193 /DNA_END=825 /DNA_ORIENTATION=+